MDISKLKDVLFSKYDINAVSIDKSNESTDGNVFIVSEENGNKYVIKVYDNINHAKSMVELHTYISKIGLKAPSIINNNENDSVIEEGNCYIVCYSFVEGVKLKETDLSTRRIEDIAKYLIALHSIKENIFNLNEVPYRARENRQSLLHFDITKQNIFINQNDTQDEICFIDFDDAKFGPSVCDVAIAATNLFISKANGLDKDGMKLFINAYYQDNNELKEKELPLIKEAAINWLESIIDNPNFDTSTKSGLENKLSIWNDINI